MVEEEAEGGHPEPIEAAEEEEEGKDKQETGQLVQVLFSLRRRGTRATEDHQQAASVTA